MRSKTIKGFGADGIEVEHYECLLDDPLRGHHPPSGNYMKGFILLFLFASLACATAANAQTDFKHNAALQGRYFLVVWGYQGQDNDVVKAHTFAGFYSGGDLARGNFNPATISWLPTTGIVNLFGSEKGRNFSLTQTLSMACRFGGEIKSWGPYEIRPELYRRALRRIKLLNSGRIAYSMIDILPGTMNCIDAAGDITRTPLDTRMSWGFAASSEVVRHLSPYFKNNGRVVKAVAMMPIWRKCSASKD